MFLSKACSLGFLVLFSPPSQSLIKFLVLNPKHRMLKLEEGLPECHFGKPKSILWSPSWRRIVAEIKNKQTKEKETQNPSFRADTQHIKF